MNVLQQVDLVKGESWSSQVNVTDFPKLKNKETVIVNMSCQLSAE